MNTARVSPFVSNLSCVPIEASFRIFYTIWDCEAFLASVIQKSIGVMQHPDLNHESPQSLITLFDEV